MYKDNLHAPVTMADAAGNNTIYDLMAAAFKQFAAEPAMGWRQLIKREMEPDAKTGKSFEKLTLSPAFEWWTYAQVAEAIDTLAAGLVKECGLKKDDKVLIYAETQRDWFISCLACLRQGAQVVTAYATLGEEGVVTSLNQTEATICVCDAKLFKTLAKCAPQCPKLTQVVAIVQAGADDAETGETSSASMAATLGSKIKVFSVLELQERGKANPCAKAANIKPADIAVIMFTSGTTGGPKGVILSHAACVAMTLSYPKATQSHTYPAPGPGDSYLGYLPLAHIMELTVECWLLSVGASIGYGSPHTLTDTGVKLKAGTAGDAPTLKPTIMLFAPAVLEKVYAAVKMKVAGSAVKEYMFSSALASGKSNFDMNAIGSGVFWNSILMSKIQALVGGRVRFMAVGSAPLSAEIQCFIQSVFNCPVMQGYGCTETCCGSCLGNVDDNTPSQVGPPSPCTYIRLRDWEEGKYLNADLDNPYIGMRRGEILIGGPSICDGYLVTSQNPDEAIVAKNKEDFVVIDNVRYFCTGDVGQVDDRGRIKIVDRKKDLFKGASGEYVALSKVEAVLKLSSFVEIPMVYGRTGASSVIALICPQKPAIVKLAAELGLDAPYGPALCQEQKIIDAVSAALKKQCKDGGILPFETPTAFRLVVAADGTPAWTPDNDLLTTTMKLKRPLIATAFAGDIDKCYA